MTADNLNQPQKRDRLAWMNQARCRDYPTEIFFPTPYTKKRYKGYRTVDEQEAIAICEQCPVQLECLDYALRNRCETGIFGGKTDAERKNIRRRRYG